MVVIWSKNVIIFHESQPPAIDNVRQNSVQGLYIKIITLIHMKKGSTIIDLPNSGLIFTEKLTHRMKPWLLTELHNED